MSLACAEERNLVSSHLLATVLFWITVAVLVLAEGALLTGMVRQSGRKARPGGFPQTNKVLETAWVLLPLVLLIGLVYLSWPSLRGT